MSKLKLSDKYIDFLHCNAAAEFLEGTTAAGKTTVGCVKFMLKVAQSNKKIHILSGLDLGTIEKNIINKELGILDVFGPLAEYNPAGKGKDSLPHIIYHTSKGNKVIYVLGYDNKARWKKALGGQYGCLYIDEINIAEIEYVREASMRCDYLIATLNPDDPELIVYKEYVNCSRPIKKYIADTPKEILSLLTEQPKENWVHWFFSFKDNLGLTKEKAEQIINNVPVGTKLYKNKIQGLRGRATGLIFNLKNTNIITEKRAENMEFTLFSVGVDTSYSQNSKDTFAFVFVGITRDKKLVTLSEEVYNNAQLDVPLSPSDLPGLIAAFADRNKDKWGFCRDVYIDSADQATITECGKYKRQTGCIYNFLPAWKKMKIIDRINLQSGWMGKSDFYILDSCTSSIKEYNSYSWKDDKHEPQDGNDHTINANQYAFLPYITKIGEQNENNR
ncbi:MAG: terminase [Oscillospiraceae bacterium]